MQYQHTPISWVLFISTFIALMTAYGAYKNRKAPGGIQFFFMMLGVAEWCLVAGFEATAVPLNAKIFWSTLEYLGSGLIAVFFLLFAAEYTGKKSWLTPRIKFFVCVYPFFNIAFAATNGWHHMLWTGFTPAGFGQNQIVYHHGILLIFVTIFVYLYLAAATLLLTLRRIEMSVLQKRQTRAIVAASIIPWVASFLYAADLSPLPGLNIIPVSLLSTGIIMLWAMVHYKLLDLSPVAREHLLELMWEGMIVIDDQKRIVDISKSAEVLFHIDIAHVLGKSIFEILSEEDPLASALEANGPSQVEVEMESENHIKCLEFRISPLKNQENHVSGYLLVCQNITERKSAERQKEKLIKELREANDTKNRFFSIVSHDLRTPFNNVLSFVRLINDHLDTLSKDEIVELSGELNRSMETTQTFLENLLHWGRSQTGVIKMNPREVYLSLIFGAVQKIAASQAQQKNITLEFPAREDICVIADLNMTATVLRNVISNAIKFSFPHGKITITAQKENHQALIRIIDEGIGMDQDTLQSLFLLDKSVSRAGTSEEKGSGLGLILCKELLIRQNGSVEVESQPGKGSVFSIRLPLGADFGEAQQE